MSSLVGTNAGDYVGIGGITALSNGNYVVGSYRWNGNRGAASWGSGTAGVAGEVSAANSLVGSNGGDNVGGNHYGDNGIKALSNGNYVVGSYEWNGNRGAASWGSGTAGVVGTISAANSLVGSNANDQVGYLGITALSNGNYVVGSRFWNGNSGAVTWGSGITGVVGEVSAANSLVGSNAYDYVGYGGITALSNGNYVIMSKRLQGSYLAVTLADGTAASSGTISAANSLMVNNPTPSGSTYSYVQEMPGTGLFHVFFKDTNIVGSAYVVSSSLTPSRYTYDYHPDADVTLHPDFITGLLNAGTAVVLQASNDITVNSAITVNNPSGNGGPLTLQAGRSILLNAAITTDNGNLNLYANEKAATGVVNAYRDAGAAVIAMASGARINAGTGTVNIRLDDGAGNSNRTSSDITLRDIIAGSILVTNGQTTGDIVLNGTLNASAANSPLTLASRRNFINNTGASALSTPSGRWLVYSTNPASDTVGRLVSDFRRITCAYGGSCAAFPGSGNGFIYSYTPMLAAAPITPVAAPITLVAAPITLAAAPTDTLTIPNAVIKESQIPSFDLPHSIYYGLSGASLVPTSPTTLSGSQTGSKATASNDSDSNIKKANAGEAPIMLMPSAKTQGRVQLQIAPELAKRFGLDLLIQF
jgi:hypothetical protein